MRKKLLAALCALSFVVPVVAFARTQPAVLGNPNEPTDSACFDDTVALGIRNVCAGSRMWSMPIIWDTAGANKVIQVGASVGLQGAVSCTYRNFDQIGLPLQRFHFPRFS